MVIACGDAGEGFKFSPLMGELLADLTEGREPDADVAALSLERFAHLDVGGPWAPTSLGGH